VKHPVAPDSSCPRSRLRPLVSVAPILSFVAGLSLLAGCPGQLEGPFPPPGSSSGTGGDSSGSGGSGTGTGGTSGSGGSSGTGGTVAACDAPTKIFKATCGTSSCHDPGATAPDLITAPVQNALIGKKATQEACAGMNFVDPSGPVSGSVLMKRLMGGTCGLQMPLVPPYLTPDQIQCVSEWLTSVLP
jgi:hypothetical protein